MGRGGDGQELSNLACTQKILFNFKRDSRIPKKKAKGLQVAKIG